VQLPPASVTNVTGVPLIGTAGEALSERIVVRVADGAQNPLPGVTVTFAVTTAGASVDPASAVTDERGEARTRWILGRTAGQQVLTASAGGSTTLQIAATAGPARPASIAVNAGNNQTGTSGGPLATNPSVIVRDASGNPVEGITVYFGVLSGAGRVAQPSAATNAQGIASAGVWTLGPSVGTQLLSAQVAQAGVNGNPVVFSATATAGTPATVTAVSPTTQSAGVGALVASPPSVVVRDVNGSPTPSVTVTFAVTGGGGQLTGATQTTNGQGIATVSSWRLGTTPGTNTVTATVAGVAPATFTATALAGAPAQVQVSAGDNQTAPVNRPVPISPQVRVVDAAGNGVAGVAVDFAVGTGGGAALLTHQITGSDGRAAVGSWILGPLPGANTLIASVTGLTSVTFNATATGGTPVSMLPVSLVTQGGVAGQVAGSPPSVVVRDAQGNPVPGIAVTFSVTSGGGTLAGATQTTGANGTATVTSWTFGPVAGTNTVVATATGLPNVTFTANTAGVPAQVIAFAGNNQAAVQGTAVATDPAVRVTDGSGQGVAGVTVTFLVTSGGGALTGGTQVTDATGVATVGSWTLGAGASNTMTATVSATGVGGNPVTFTASAATQIAVTQQPPATIASGANFTVTVQLRDAANALSPVTGLPLTISLASGGGTLNAAGTGLTVNTATGFATFNVNITGTSGARTLRISGTGVGNVVTTAVTIP
jgi:adhesin/invasin